MVSAYDVRGLTDYSTTIGQGGFDNYMSQLFTPKQWEASFNAQLANDSKVYNAYEAQKAREFNSIEAQKQRDFEARMSNTAFSRAVFDMQRSGLNPYLATGASASTPQGVSATGSSAYASAHSVSSATRGVIGEAVGLGVQLASTALKLAQ